MSYFGECEGGPECAVVHISHLLCQASLDQREHSYYGGTRLNPQIDALARLLKVAYLSVCPRTRQHHIEQTAHWDRLIKKLPLTERERASEIIRRELARPAAVLQESGSSGSWRVPQLR